MEKNMKAPIHPCPSRSRRENPPRTTLTASISLVASPTPIVLFAFARALLGVVVAQRRGRCHHGAELALPRHEGYPSLAHLHRFRSMRWDGYGRVPRPSTNGTQRDEAGWRCREEDKGNGREGLEGGIDAYSRGGGVGVSWKQLAPITRKLRGA